MFFRVEVKVWWSRRFCGEVGSFIRIFIRKFEGFSEVLWRMSGCWREKI